MPQEFPNPFDIQLFADQPNAPGVNPYSAIELRGTLRPIALGTGADKLARTVNGTLISLAAPQMRKYKLEISGNAPAPPALDGLWVGMQVVVNSLVEIGFLTAGGAPARTPVDGSLRQEGDYTYYRPYFTMLVVDFDIGRDSWAANVPWSLTLEEV